jgi:hypothetical protein
MKKLAARDFKDILQVSYFSNYVIDLCTDELLVRDLSILQALS